MRADADSSCTESYTDSWHHWLGSLCGQAAPRTSRSSCCATNSLCCADRSTDPSSPTPTAACSQRSRPRSRGRAEPGGWSPPTRCCAGTAPHRPTLDPTTATAGPATDGSGASPTRTAPRSRESDLGLPPHPRRTCRARPPPRCVHGLADPQQRPNRPRPHTLGSHLVAVPAVPGRRRLRLRHHRNRHAAQFYLLFFIDIPTRTVYFAGVTHHPTASGPPKRRGTC